MQSLLLIINAPPKGKRSAYILYMLFFQVSVHTQKQLFNLNDKNPNIAQWGRLLSGGSCVPCQSAVQVLTADGNFKTLSALPSNSSLSLNQTWLKQPFKQRISSNRKQSFEQRIALCMAKHPPTLSWKSCSNKVGCTPSGCCWRCHS